MQPLPNFVAHNSPFPFEEALVRRYVLGLTHYHQILHLTQKNHHLSYCDYLCGRHWHVLHCHQQNPPFPKTKVILYWRYV